MKLYRKSMRYAVTVIPCLALLITLLPMMQTYASGRTNASGIVIGVAMKTQLQRRWKYDVQYMQQEATKLGDTLKVVYANDDPTLQKSQVETLLNQGIKALIIVPVDDKVAALLVNEAASANVPVVSYDILAQSPKVAYSVQRNNTLAGQLQIQAAIRAVPKGNYALLLGDMSNSVSRIMTAQWGEYLAPSIKAGKIHILLRQPVKNYDPETALNDTENLLSAHKDNVQAILSLNDGMATGIIRALHGRHLDGKVFVSGLDGDPANVQFIRRGTQAMTVWTRIDLQGKYAALAADTLGRGHKQPSNVMYSVDGTSIPGWQVPTIEVTARNLCYWASHIAPKGWLTPQQTRSINC